MLIIASGPVIVENGKVLLNKSGEDMKSWAWFETKNLPNDLAGNIKPTLIHFGFNL